MIRFSIALTILVSTLTAAAAEHDRPDLDFADDYRDFPAQPSPSGTGSARFEPARSRADRVEPPTDSAPVTAVDAAADGSLSLFSVSPTIPRAANGVTLGGYDGAAQSFRARGATEGRLADFLAARVEYDHGPANGPQDRVSIGLRATFLKQAVYGVDLGAVAFYQPRDFREEGNVVAGLLVARHFDRLTLVMNPMAGSDPEGDDRSFELRMAGLYKATPWLVLGFDSRGRYNLSSDQKRAGSWSLDWEMQSGASAAFGLGPALLTTLVGPSLLHQTQLSPRGVAGEQELRRGLLAMAGLGAAF